MSTEVVLRGRDSARVDGTTYFTKPTQVCDPQAFLNFVRSKEGCSYIFGRKGPNTFDCSGLVTWAIKQAGGPDWRFTHNAQGLADVLQPVDRLAVGEVLLAFYGYSWDHVDHVMVLVPDGRVFGACGGDHTTTTPEKALEQGACVQYRPRADYSRGHTGGLLGFRALRYRFTTPKPGAPADA